MSSDDSHPAGRIPMTDHPFWSAAGFAEGEASLAGGTGGSFEIEPVGRGG
jgi:hypothetical protein